MNSETTIEKEIKDVMKEWGNALLAKDLDRMHQDHDFDGYRLFDVGTTVQGVEASKNLWRQCLPYFDQPKVNYKDLIIRTNGDMAVVHFKSQVTGTVEPMPESMQSIWMRGTVCYQKIDGRWQCFHEHISLPVNCESMNVAEMEESTK